MSDMTLERRPASSEAVGTIPLDEIDPGHPRRFQSDTMWPVFERLRREAPVHYTPDSMFGPYWSVSRYRDVMQVEANHAVFSSDSSLGGITIRDSRPNFRLPMFIAMDPPKHDRQREVVNPVAAPANVARLEAAIRARAADILDALPRGETFDWVERVSIELTTQMLAILLDFPWEDRRKLTRWSDVATAIPGGGIVDSEEQREAELLDVVACGISAIVWRHEATEKRLVQAVVAAARGDGTLPGDLLGRLINQVGALHRSAAGREGVPTTGLTPREVEVLRLAADGLDTGEIAAKLAYSERTIKNVMHGLTTRFHLRNRAHAVAYAFKEGYL